MADIKYYDVILKPVVTEKSMNAMAEKKYTFLVHPSATKNQIKEAVEKMFEGTKVAKVNTMNNDGKTKRRGMTFGKTAKTKKAIVPSRRRNAAFRGRSMKSCRFLSAARVRGSRKIPRAMKKSSDGSVYRQSFF